MYNLTNENPRSRYQPQPAGVCRPPATPASPPVRRFFFLFLRFFLGLGSASSRVTGGQCRFRIGGRPGAGLGTAATFLVRGCFSPSSSLSSVPRVGLECMNWSGICEGIWQGLAWMSKRCLTRFSTRTALERPRPWRRRRSPSLSQVWFRKLEGCLPACEEEPSLVHSALSLSSCSGRKDPAWAFSE